ncbi:hypothetical protein K501DRAFT_284534 [Backusella circina FSU 941]|nr:hypothetical protein K501DRAFT_284534 [Backusella circina FSU 941]
MCDLTDPRILETYNSIIEGDQTDWLILGYNDTRDVISLYSQGSQGLSELRNNLSDEVLYAFLRVDDRFILITWVSEKVSGVRRARALVHSRSVASLLKLHNAQVTASTLNDLSDANIRTRLKLGDNQTPSRRTSSSQKRASRRLSAHSPSSPEPETQLPMPTSPEPQQQPVYSEPQETFEEASETLPSQLDEQQRQEEEERVRQQEERMKKEAAEAKAAADAKAAAEAKKREELEKKKAAEEEEARKKRAESEALRLKEEKAQIEKEARLAEEREKKALQQRLLEAEKNKDVVLSGFVSVQPSSSPFWRRRYFTIKGKSLVFYRDELNTTPVTVLDLSSVIRLNNVNVDSETFVPNAFVLETKQNGAYQLFADDKKDRETIITALRTVI